MKDKVIIFFYKTLVNILFIVGLVLLPFIYLFSEKRRATLGFRLGFKTGLCPKKTGEKRIWIHALSVGEVISALPFIHALKDQYKDLDIVFTASTKTGFDMARHLFLENTGSEKDHGLVNQLGYFPYDLGYCVKRISRQIDPDAVVIVETDLWPNFLYEMNKTRTPVLLINARLSKRSLKGYLKVKNFSSLFFSSLAGIMAQTPLDEKRFQRLGIDKRKIVVAGNIKFDQPRHDMDETYVETMKSRFGIQNKTRVFIAGSTHEGEEKALCEVYKEVKNKFPEFLMILAPRDPKRCLAIRSYFLSHKVSSVFLSTMKDSDEGPSVVLVDKMGELSRLYAICDVAFIGGSMVEQGGHNPLEPAAFSKPVLFGPDMSDFLVVSTWLLNHGGARKVTSESELKKELEILMENKQIRQQMGIRSFEIFSRHSGAVQRIIKHMEYLSIV